MTEQTMTVDDYFADPVGQCSKCGRKTWEPGMVGQTCHMPQPPGAPEPTCSGTFWMMSDDQANR